MSNTEKFRAARDLLLAHRDDYAGARKAFSWPQFEDFNFAYDWFDAVAKDPARADAAALILTEPDGSSARYSWAELSRRSTQVARWLSENGFKRQDTMIVMLGNEVALWEIMLAGMKLGAIIIPSTTQLTSVDLADRIERGKANWIVTSYDQLPKLEQAPGDYTTVQVRGEAHEGTLHFDDSHQAPADFALDTPTRADETLLLYFTSGTTSQAKLVQHTHVSYPVGHLATMYWIGLEPGDVHLNVASPGWGKHAWSNFFGPWIAEATVFVYNYERFDPKALMHQMDVENVTSFCAPPTVWRYLIQADLSVLRTPPRKLVSAGEPLNREVIEQVRNAWGQVIRDGYGQTETTVQIANPPGEPVKVGAMGRPMPGYEIELRNPTTGQLAEVGEICLRLDPRPVGLMKGYFEDQAKTDQATRDGVYRTGDIAERDAEGVLTYVGRADDVFKSSDYKLSPFELESVVLEHPAVAEAAVVPSPDPMKLSVPKVFVVLAPGHEPTAETAESILGYCRVNLAPYKRIRRLEFSELPKTISGKIRRVELRLAESDQHAKGQVPPKEYRDTDFPSLKSLG
ncbi:AMP-binding protein [Glutamicibacter soli]|uniref:AMP-binding protein n=1 Tax=Glutamicibacter soli TaxID=453836 RepID=A0A6L9GEQ7_9MICC|nr:AMP-binding protein [Glutamicibacter soli]NAZ17796.1 AMP-binding protein [Glutamicibacter soli]